MTSERTGKGGVDELHILWISEGMSCDGATVSMKAAAQPSIEDVARGLLPGPPNVHVQDKALAYDGIEERAARAHVRLGAIVGPRRSTGIVPEARWPIDPRTPKLTPP